MISAIVPTYRGRERLERNLPSVASSLAAAGEPWEIVVVDDGGGGLGPLPQGARPLGLDDNRGYGAAVNAGAEATRGELLLVLNDDLRLETETVARLRAFFPDPSLFAVVPAILSPLAACGDEGGKRGVFEAGLLELREAPASRSHPTLYPVGCCFLCRRALFLELGGYDRIYAPFLWEDVDLGYRAWRRGLRVLHAPEARCHHEGSATLDETCTLAERERIGFRNRALFHLANLASRERRAQCFGALAAFALLEPLRERREGLALALERFGPRPREARAGLSDEAILASVDGP